uniref:Uncharacterized protein n=1 Tax=Panagrolaimus sp. PS1159 TaxID=55785 RepID=A0AC35FM46_9BILA
MSSSPPSLNGSPSIRKRHSSSISSSSSTSTPPRKMPTINISSLNKKPRKLPFWKPLKVAPLSSYREREEMIKAIINRQISNTYDKFYDNLGISDYNWSKTEFQITVVKTIRNLIFEGSELAKFYQKLQEDFDMKDEKIKTLEAEVEAKSKENDEIQKDHSIMEEQLNSATVQINTMEQTIDDLQEELIDAKQEADAAIQQKEEIKGQINAEAILLFEKWTKLMEKAQKIST